MIIFRYITKEVASTLTATTVILLLIFLSTQFVHYLSGAALGKYASQVLLHLMVLQIPMLLGLLFPAGLFLGLLMALGRFSADREMVVLSSCGFSQWSLIKIVMVLAAVVMIIVTILNFWVTPKVILAQKELFAKAKAAPLIDTILPGRFYAMDDGSKVFYIEQIARDRSKMNNLFFAEKNLPNQQNKTGPWTVVVASQGYKMQNEDGHFVVVANGQRYQGMPGANDFQIDKFEKYFLRLEDVNPIIKPDEQTMPISQLWHTGHKDKNMEAELQWRISAPITVLILALLAVPLSFVNPRQGRYAQLLPAIMIYIFYANMMFLVRSWLQAGLIPYWVGVWWLHGLILLIAIILLARQGRWLEVWRYQRH